ncbi:hypothetical protein [Tsukamurella ocularis]|uniref:hypothetical protein n=1 Tax=Tsukamurella ocularis TaxID=1970234 RepID=UPI002166CFB6|nr:hypothetical protein [Tsukamurella ocularis]MCS3782465.1 hypothetical protein [Tsukamurella ocularis]MCS3789983.1 hypothetical protein [Tsukamurella ocularis]MCS3853255.1 hypothetical protein [Tsukamurella ocularis]
MRRFHAEYSTREQCYEIGIEVPTGRFYLSIPVGTGMIDYDEYYYLSENEHRHFMNNTDAATAFADECRNHRHDARLIMKPGSNRGAPIWPIRPNRGSLNEKHADAHKHDPPPPSAAQTFPSEAQNETSRPTEGANRMAIEDRPYDANASSVSIVRTAPKSKRPQTTDAILLAIGLAAGVIVYLMGIGWGLLVVLVVLGLGVLHFISLARAKTAVGEPLITVSASGIQSKGFSLPWDRVVAMEFVFAKAQYLPNASTKTKATDRAVNSLVVTSTDRDDNGSPLQYGTTLLGNNYSDNFNELRAAAQRYCPRIQFRTEIGSADYALRADQVERSMEELVKSGKITIRNGRGRSTGASLDTDGFTNEGSTIRWADASFVIAYTYVHTTQTSFGDATKRKQRLAILQTKQDASGNHIPFRFGFLGFDYIGYGPDWSPSIEELAVLIDRIAPHVRFIDQRTGS